MASPGTTLQSGSVNGSADAPVETAAPVPMTPARAKPRPRRARRCSSPFPATACAARRSPFRFVDPILDQACARHIAMLVTQAMRLTQVGRQHLVIVAQLGEHVQWRHEIRVVVEN